MHLTIWRHGEAGDAPRDRDRRLTAAGIEGVERGTGRFAALCDSRSLPVVDHILHSPWVRTTATAGIVQAGLGTPGVEPCEAVRPGAGPESVDSLLAPLFYGDNCPAHLLLVSHQPLVSRLIDHYLGDGGSVPPLSPGGLATLLLDAPDAGCGSLLFWALPPLYKAGA